MYYWRRLSVALGLVTLSIQTSQAQPRVERVPETLTHKESITIGGSAFGTKSPATPLWWDDGEGAPAQDMSLLRKGDMAWVVSTLDGSRKHYSDAWPKAVTRNDGYSNMQYRAVQHRKVPGPHPHSTQYLVGCHDEQGECLGGEVGQNVGLTVSDGERHHVWYVSYYLRLDPLWPKGDENYKYFNWETNPPFDMYTNPFCYDNVNGCRGGLGERRRSPGCKEKWIGGPHMIQLLDRNNCGDWIWRDDGDPSEFGYPVITFDKDVKNPALDWVREEHILDTTKGNELYITRFNNVDMVNTDRDKEGDCTFVTQRYPEPFGGATLGGFWKQGACGNGQDDLNNDACRFFDDVYVDNTYSRVIIGDAPKYADCKIVEPQIPVEWSESSITLVVNQGALPNGKNYLYIFDSGNLSNTAGFPVEISGSPDSK